MNLHNALYGAELQNNTGDILIVPSCYLHKLL